VLRAQLRTLLQRYRDVSAYRPRHSTADARLELLGSASFYDARTGAWAPRTARGIAAVPDRPR